MMHHYSKFISLMENYDLVNKASESALNSQGSAMAENEKALDSVSGKWKIFMAGLNSTKLSLFEGDSLKSILDIGIAITDITSKLGGFKLVVSGLLLLTAKKSGLFEFFNLIRTDTAKNFGEDMMAIGIHIKGGFKDAGKSIKDVVTSLISLARGAKGASGEMALYTIKTNLATVANKALAFAAKAAKAAMTLGFSLAISFAIEQLIKLVSNVANAKKELNEFNEEMARTFVSDNKTLASGKDIQRKISNTEIKIKKSTNETEKEQLEAELLGYQKQMAELLPETTTAFDENGNAIATNNDLIRQHIKLLKDVIATNEAKFLEENKFSKEKLKDLQEQQKKYDAMLLAQAKGENKINYDYTYEDYDVNTGAKFTITENVTEKFRAKDLEKLREEIDATSGSWNTFVNNINRLKAQGFSDEEIKKLNYDLDLYEEYTKLLKENTDAKEENQQVEVAPISPEQAGINFSQALIEAESLKNLIDQINEAQRLTPEIIQEIIDKYPTLADKIHSVEEVQNELNKKLEDQIGIQEESYMTMVGVNTEAYRVMVANDVEFYNTKIKNSDRFKDYTIDMLNLMQNANIDYYNNNIEGMRNDLNNAQSLAQARAILETNLVQSLAGLWGSYYRTLSSSWYTSAPVYQYAAGKGTALYDETNRILARQNEIASQAQKLANAMSSFAGAAYAGYSPANFSSLPKGSGGSGGGGGASDAEKDAQDERVRLEEEANNKIKDLRDKLVNALKKKYDELREKELEPLDKEIQMKQKELERLQNGGKDEKERLAALKEELRLWQMNDSSYSKEKIDELKKQVKEAELNLEIKDLEDKKEAVNNKYDALLEEEKIYAEASKMIQQNKYSEMKDLLTQYGEDFKEIAVLLGKSVADLIKEQLDSVKNAYNFLKGTGSNSSGSSSSGSSSSSGGAITKGSKVKVKDNGAGIYIDSYGGSVGTWKGAGVSTTEGLYVVNTNNGRAALSRTNNINGAIGWIDMSKIARFATGGDVGTWGNNNGRLAVVDSGERVLTQEQNKLFGKLVYEILPQLANINPVNDLAKLAQNVKNMVNTSNLAINNNYSVVNNTPFDVRKFELKLEEMITKALNKAGVRVKY